MPKLTSRIEGFSWRAPLFSFVIISMLFYQFFLEPADLEEDIILFTEDDTGRGIIYEIAGTNDCSTDQFGSGVDGDSVSDTCTAYGCDKLASGISPAACGSGNCGDGANPDTAVWMASGSGTGSDCCGDDSAESFSSGADGTGCCCNNKQLAADDTFCSTNSKWCVDGTYSSSDVYDAATSGTTISGNDIVDGCDATAVSNAYICDTSGNTGSADGVCVDNDGDSAGTTYSCDTGEVCDDGSHYADDCGDCASETACDSNVNSGGTTPTYSADGMCGEADADDTSDDCLTGATCRDSEDSNHLNEGCECASAITDWDPYDSSGGTSFSANGICISTTADTSGHACLSGSSYYTDCSNANCNSATGTAVACDSSITDGAYSTDGICGEADSDNNDNDCMTGAACKNSEDSNAIMEGCECNSDATDWDAYDSSVSNGAFSANGICVGTTADTSGEACYDGANYQTDCSSCSDGDLCDSDITNGAYSADGTCSDGGTCTAAGTMSKSGSNYYAGCDTSRECDSNSAGGYGRDGYCASTSCCTGAIVSGEYGTGPTGGSEASFNSANENCDCDAGVTDQGRACASTAASGSPDTDGICIDAACKTGTVWCTCTGACSTSDITDANCGNSCPGGTACDADVGAYGFEQDGICEDNGEESCVTSGEVAYDGSSVYYESCDALGGGDSGHACDSTFTNGDFVQDGICTGGTTCTTSGSVYESDNVTSTVNSLKAGCAVDGSPCISDVTAVSGTAAEDDFNGICISNTCDTNEVAWNGAAGWAAACTSVEGYQCEPQGVSDTNTLFDSEGYCVDNQAATIICCGDAAGEDIASGETTGTADVGVDAECGCSSDTDENMCDAEAGGTFAADGICAKDAASAWDCDTDEVCDDGTDIRDDCQQCGDEDTCWSDADGSQYAANGICTDQENNCCTDFANGTATGPDYCGTESQICTNAPTTGPWYCDDVDDASWDASGSYLCDDDGGKCIECAADKTDKASATNAELNGDGKCEVVCGAASGCDEVALGTDAATCCYSTCLAQTCACSSATLDDGGDSCCYVPGGDYCSSVTGCTNVTETCPDYCIDDNDGGACAQSTRTDPTSAETCYWTDTCADSGCSLTSGTENNMRADYCDYCTASGVTTGDYCPETNASCSSDCANSGTIYYEAVIDRTNDCSSGTCQLSTDTLTRGDVWDGTSAATCDDNECFDDCVDVGNTGGGSCVAGACDCNAKPSPEGSISWDSSNANITLTNGGTKAVSFWVNFTDADGDSDISSAIGDLYVSPGTAGSDTNNNDDYHDSSCDVIAGDSDNRVIVNCTFTLQFNAAPSSSWAININASDGVDNDNISRKDVAIEDLVAAQIPDSFDYSMVTPGAAASTVAVTLNNSGNVELDFKVSGTDWTCDVGGTFDVNKTKYDATNVGYGSMDGFLTTSADDTIAEISSSFDLAKSTTTSGASVVTQKDIHFAARIPVGYSGVCRQSLTIAQQEST